MIKPNGRPGGGVDLNTTRVNGGQNWKSKPNSEADSRLSTAKVINEFVFHISKSIAPARTILLIISSLIRTQKAFDHPLPPHLAEKRLEEED